VRRCTRQPLGPARVSGAARVGARVGARVSGAASTRASVDVSDIRTVAVVEGVWEADTRERGRASGPYA
jgi:hypothetical protein